MPVALSVSVRNVPSLRPALCWAPAFSGFPGCLFFGIELCHGLWFRVSGLLAIFGARSLRGGC